MGMETKHYQEERGHRKEVAEEIGRGNVMYKCLVDKGHRDGKEWHSITDTGLILIENAATGRYITTLIARPGQLSRYERGWYGMVERILDKNGREVSKFKLPHWLYKLAQEHQRDGYNFS